VALPTQVIGHRIRQIGLERVFCGSDMPAVDESSPPALAWARPRYALPLPNGELRVIANNVAPWLRCLHPYTHGRDRWDEPGSCTGGASSCASPPARPEQKSDVWQYTTWGFDSLPPCRSAFRVM
jgi:hypothetical protein